jgi:putative transposase
LKFNCLKINSDVEYYGKKFKVWGIEPPYVDLKRNEGDGEIFRITFSELVSNPSFKPSEAFFKDEKKGKVTYQSSMDVLTDKNKNRTSLRYEQIRPIVVFRKGRANDLRAIHEFMHLYKEYMQDGETFDSISQKLLIERIAKKYNVGERTINRYLSKYLKSENELASQGLEGLIPKSGIVLQRKLTRLNKCKIHVSLFPM